MESFGVRLRNETAIRVPRSLRVITTYVLLEQEAWFEDEVDFVSRCVRPGDCAVDVGANFGVYATVLARAVGPKGRVFALEPTSTTAAYLRLTAEAASIDVIQAAASNHPGDGSLRMEAAPEMNKLTPDGDPGTGIEKVRLVRLDDEVTTGDRRVSLLKIDAEGHEFQVTEGARTLLRRHDPLVLFEASHPGGFQYDLIAHLRTLGCEIFRLVPGLGILAPLARDEVPDPFQVNLFACGRDRAGELARAGVLTESVVPLLDPSLATSELDSSADWVCTGAGAATGQQKECLAHYARSRDKSLVPAQRLGHLLTALHYAREAGRERASVARLATFVQIALECGYRNRAASVLGQLGPFLHQNIDFVIDESCLIPDLRGAALPTDRRTLRLRVLEAYERVRAFSSIYAGPERLPVLDSICQEPDCLPEMHRRRQLGRILTGVQRGPEAHPALVRESLANLNAWFWRGEF